MNHRSQQEPQPDDSQHWRRPMDSELGSLLFFFFLLRIIKHKFIWIMSRKQKHHPTKSIQSKAGGQ